MNYLNKKDEQTTKKDSMETRLKAMVKYIFSLLVLCLALGACNEDTIEPNVEPQSDGNPKICVACGDVEEDPSNGG